MDLMGWNQKAKVHWLPCPSLCDMLPVMTLMWFTPCLLPPKLTWNLKITPLKKKIIFQNTMFGFHVTGGVNRCCFVSLGKMICMTIKGWPNYCFEVLKYFERWDAHWKLFEPTSMYLLRRILYRYSVLCNHSNLKRHRSWIAEIPLNAVL